MFERKDLDYIESIVYMSAFDFMEMQGFSDDEIDDYLAVEVTDYKGDGSCARVEVRAELGYDGLEELIDLLNKDITEFDDKAYFEPEEPGIITAFLWDKDVESCQDVEVEGAVKSEGMSASDYFSDDDLMQFADQIIYDANEKVSEIDPDIDILLEDVYIVDYNRLVIDFIDSVHDFDIQAVSTNIDMDDINDETDLYDEYSWLSDEIVKVYDKE